MIRPRRMSRARRCGHPGRATLAAVAVIIIAAWPASHARGDSLVDALKNGDVGVSLRYRAERVSDDAPLVAENDAVASTIRTTLSYGSAPFYGFSAFLQFEDVSNLGYADHHNDTTNGIGDHPVIADPAGTDLEQAYLRYSLSDIVDVTAGRITLSLAQERYVGPVGWRQNHQSFDAAEVAVRVIPRTTIRVLYIDNVLRIFGDNREMSSPLLDATVRVGSSGRATAYYYHLDYDDPNQSGDSTATAGLRWENTWDLPGQWSIPYMAEYAKQKDAGDNPMTVDARYARFEVGGKRKSLVLKAGYELLGGESGEGAFSTPLATLHKWNGWADKFLTTPPDGLVDLYLSAGYGWKDWSGSMVYHDFSSDSEDLDYGTELDAVVQWSSPWKQVFAAKAALYDADEHAFDTTKYWVYTSWSM